MSHTPGPWFYDSVDTPFVLCDGVCEGGDDSGVRTVFTTDGQETIAVLYPIEKDEVRYYQDANASLIAAAPDLLEALEELVAECGVDPKPLNGMSYFDAQIGPEAYQAAKAAIAKAKEGLA